MRRLYRLMMLAAGTRQPQLASALKASVVGSVAQAAAYGMLVGLLHELASSEPRGSVAWRWFAAFLLCYLLEAAMRLRELRFQYAEWATVMSDVRLELGSRLRAMPLQQLEKRAAGDLSAVVGGNVAYATMGASQVAFLFLQALIVPVVLVVIVLAVDWRVGLVLVLTLPAAIPFVRSIQRRGGATFRAVNKADAEVSARIVEYVQGMPVLRATGQTGASSERLDAALRHQTQVMTAGQKSLTLPSIVATTAMQLGIVAAVALGAWLVFDDRLSAALVAGLAIAAIKLAEPLANAASMVAVFELSEASVERIGEIMDVEPLPARGVAASIARFDIVFDDVTFTYEGHQTAALTGVSFTVPPRSLTALVGPSGSGKSTIAKLITRYDDPSSGNIRIGGVDLRDVESSGIYRHVAVVFQDVYLFHDTLRENIAMARPGASDAEVEAAARAAHVHEFASRLPLGYDTPLGELGGRLSGGERQRVSIARAILKDAPIVLLDEPTAALDSHSEVAVQEAIDALVADKTVLVIAHRLSTVAAADQILVLQDGGIVENGTHAELLEADGRYAAMWEAQTRARHWRVSAHVPEHSA